MTKQELIDLAHGAQNDAGSQSNFNQCVTHAESVFWHKKLTDPVAAFLGALLALNNGDADAAAGSADFYLGELSRAVEAIETSR